jgi:hypothetical protein
MASIVDYLKSIGRPSDFASRSVLAGQQGITNYTGTAEQNLALLGKLQTPRTPPGTYTGGGLTLNVPQPDLSSIESQVKNIQSQIPIIQSAISQLPPVSPTTSDVNIGANVPPTATTTPALSISGEAAARAKILQDTLRQQADEARARADAAQAKIDQYTATQREVLETTKATIPEPLRLGYEEAKQKELYVTKNFEANQKLVDELETLLTEGNELIKQQKEQTGLGAIRNPRINQTISDVNARTGVIEATINARNGQISQAYTMIDRVVDEAKVFRNDQLSYYTNLYNFYENLKDTEGKKLVSLTSDEKSYINAQISLLEQQNNQAQEVSNTIKQAMIDPNTALAYSEAGVTLNDTVEQIKEKLANYAYTREVQQQNDDMALKGYSYLVPGQSTPSGSETITTQDRFGNEKTWYKPKEVKPSDLTPNQQFNAAMDLAKFVSGQTKLSQEVIRNANGLQTLWNNHLSGQREVKSLNAVSQAIITSYAKILDPGSVVRESEYARTPEGLSLLGRADGWLERMKRGGAGLTEKDLQSFVDAVNLLATEAKKQIDSETQRAIDFGKRTGVDTTFVGGGYYSEQSTPQGQTAPPQSVDLSDIDLKF